MRTACMVVAVVGAVGLVAIFGSYAIMATTDLPDVGIWRAVTGLWQSWLRWLCGCVPDSQFSCRTTEDALRTVVVRKMSAGYKLSQREKIRDALRYQMPPLSWAEQCWLYEAAFGEQIVTRKRCEVCNDEGCEVCSG